MREYAQFMTEVGKCKFCGANVPSIKLGDRHFSYLYQVGRCSCEKGRRAWEAANGKAITGWEIANALGKEGVLMFFDNCAGSLPSAESVNDIVFLGGGDPFTAFTKFFVTDNPSITLDYIDKKSQVQVIGNMRFIFTVTDINSAREVISSLFM